jgi:hypothetical protein
MAFHGETAERMNWREWRVAGAALAASMLPVMVLFALRGYSCGHDLPFHLGSWQDAAQQLRRGGWPQWDYMAARGAGEPRFVFYPPVSWLVGAGLRLLMSPEHASVVFVLLALSACWCAMFVAARYYTTGVAAMVSATLYALGPYTLFNALERSAYAELLAMALLPLLFVAVLRGRVRMVQIAVPIALLWLTNVPTAIIGSYMVALLGAMRLMGTLRGGRGAARYVFTVVAGVAIGIGLAGFFLAPAVHQQAAVQIDAAFSEGQTVADNFLLRHTEHTRRGVIHEVSLTTAEELVVLVLALAGVGLRVRRSGVVAAQAAGLSTASAKDADSGRDDRLGVAKDADFGREDKVEGWREGSGREGSLAGMLAVGAVVVLFLLLPWSAMVWEYLPKLSVLQFPWRLLCVLSMLSAFAVGIWLRPYLTGRSAVLAAVLVIAAMLGGSGFRQFWLDPQGHEDDGVMRSQALPVVERRATSEYTPVGDENDGLREGGPGYWLRLRSTGVAGGPAHGDLVEGLHPLAHAGSDAVAPGHLEVELAEPELLVLDLRAYPAWRVLCDGAPAKVLPRPDGLIAVALPAGRSVLDVDWVNGWDRKAGALLSSLCALVLLWVSRRTWSAIA